VQDDNGHYFRIIVVIWGVITKPEDKQVQKLYSASSMKDEIHLKPC